MLAENVETNVVEDSARGVVVDVFVADLYRPTEPRAEERIGLSVNTPDDWEWKPACFAQDRGPILDLSNLYTSFDTGWSFRVSQPTGSNPEVYNVGYQIRAEVLDDDRPIDHPVLSVTIPRGTSLSITRDALSVTGSVALDVALDTHMNITELSASATLSLGYSLEALSLPAVPVASILGADFAVGVGIDVDFALNLSTSAELTSAHFGLGSYSIEPEISIGLSAFGEARVGAGYVAKAWVKVTGSVSQSLKATYGNDSWTLTAPGSLDLDGFAYASLAGGLFGLEVEYHAFHWEITAWDFLEPGEPPAPPSESLEYDDPTVVITTNLSLNAAQPTLYTVEYVTVSAAATSPIGILSDGDYFTTWTKSGTDWTDPTVWDQCSGTATLGPLADGVYRIQATATDSQGRAGLSADYYFEVDATPAAGNDLQIYSRRQTDDFGPSDDDGVVEQNEGSELSIRLKNTSTSELSAVSVTAIWPSNIVDIYNEEVWYDRIAASRVPSFAPPQCTPSHASKASAGTPAPATGPPPGVPALAGTLFDA